jgi:hypothetical protein
MVFRCGGWSSRATTPAETTRRTTNARSGEHDVHGFNGRCDYYRSPKEWEHPNIGDSARTPLQFPIIWAITSQSSLLKILAADDSG